jgi:quercetin dioxygenase-like cupin family protein
MRAGKKVLRLYADAAGESRFADDGVTLSLQEFAPPLFVSSADAASRYIVMRLPAGWFGEPHAARRRQIMFCLAGRLKVTASTGDARVIETSDAWLMEDTTGKGHATEVISATDAEAVIIQLE